MKYLVRSVALLSCIVFLPIFLLQSCKKEEKPPQSTEQKVDSLMNKQAGAAADTSKSAASGSMPLNENAKKGQLLFYNASLGKIKASCAMCHSDGTDRTKDGRTRAGHTLVGVTSRTSTWNGMFKADKLKSTAYGAKFCASGFQERGPIDNALSADEVNSLNEYFAAIASNPGAMTTTLTIKWVTKPVFGEDDELDAKATTPAVKAIMKLPGDPGSGQAVFQGTCITCHEVTKKKIGPSMKDAAQDMNFVAEAIRCGSKAMPFFAKDVLSDQQIADVVAFIQSSLNK